MRNTYPQVEVELKTGSGGIFDVEADDALIFSKDDEHRFPANREILEKLEGLLKKQSG